MLFVITITIFTIAFTGLYWYIGQDLSNWFLILWAVLGLLSSLILNIVTVILYLLGASKTDPKKKFKHFVLYNALWITCKFLNYKITIEGLENKPNGTYVIYSNHKSMMDPIFIYLALHDRISAVGKKSLFSLPVLNIIAKAFGALPIDRENDREALKSMIKAINQVKDGLPMIIFPEGGIKSRETERMVDLKPGAYKLAVKSLAPILPISLVNTSKIDDSKLFQRKEVKVVIHNCIPFD